MASKPTTARKVPVIRTAPALCAVGETYRGNWGAARAIGEEFELNIAAEFAAGGSPFAPSVRARFRTVFDWQRPEQQPEGFSTLIQRIA